MLVVCATKAGFSGNRALTALFLCPILGFGCYCGREDMAYVQGVSLKVMLPSSTVFNSRSLRRPQGFEVP